jgi:hypothetical protein
MQARVMHKSKECHIFNEFPAIRFILRQLGAFCNSALRKRAESREIWDRVECQSNSIKTRDKILGDFDDLA